MRPDCLALVDELAGAMWLTNLPDDKGQATATLLAHLDRYPHDAVWLVDNLIIVALTGESA